MMDPFNALNDMSAIIVWSPLFIVPIQLGIFIAIWIAIYNNMQRSKTIDI